MTERWAFGFGIAGLATAVAGLAFIASGGLLALPLAGVLGAAAVYAWMRAPRPRAPRAHAGLALGCVSVVSGIAYIWWEAVA